MVTVKVEVEKNVSGCGEGSVIAPTSIRFRHYSIITYLEHHETVSPQVTLPQSNNVSSSPEQEGE